MNLIAISCVTASYVTLGCGHATFTKTNGQQVRFEKTVLISYEYDDNRRKVYKIHVPNYIQSDFESFLKEKDITSFNVDIDNQTQTSSSYLYPGSYQTTTVNTTKNYHYKVYKFIEGLDIDRIDLGMTNENSETFKTEKNKNN